MVSVLLEVPFRCVEPACRTQKLPSVPLAHTGMASWFCFNSSPRGCGWSSFSGHSWSSPGLIGRSLGQRVGAGRGGAEGWRKCLLSQVTRGADASTHEGPWVPGQRLGDNPRPQLLSQQVLGRASQAALSDQLECGITIPLTRGTAFHKAKRILYVALLLFKSLQLGCL